MTTKDGNIFPKVTSLPEPAGSAPTVAAALKAARKEYGLTQQQVADLAGVSDRTVRTLEQGGTNPSLKALLAVTDTLGLTVEVVRR